MRLLLSASFSRSFSFSRLLSSLTSRSCSFFRILREKGVLIYGDIQFVAQFIVVPKHSRITSECFFVLFLALQFSEIIYYGFYVCAVFAYFDKFTVEKADLFRVIKRQPERF